MLTGYITWINQDFSVLRMGSLAVISYKLVKQEYRYQINRPIISKRMSENYPDIRLDTSGNHILH